MTHLALMAPKGNGVSGGSWVELTPSMYGRKPIQKLTAIHKLCFGNYDSDTISTDPETVAIQKLSRFRNYHSETIAIQKLRFGNYDSETIAIQKHIYRDSETTIQKPTRFRNYRDSETHIALRFRNYRDSEAIELQIRTR